MSTHERRRIGFSCSYTPLPLIDAAGFTPYRILPLGEARDQAGSLLHENMCPHVKRLLDRALAADLPELAGVVFMNSCDTMRRLADAWSFARPGEPTILVDLPTTADEGSVSYLAAELARLAEQLSRWAGHPVTTDTIASSAASYRELASALNRLEQRATAGKLPGGRRRLQELYNQSVTRPLEDSLEEFRRIEAEPDADPGHRASVPLYLFGNVLPDPAAFQLFDACGAFVVADDLCTGSRQISPLRFDVEQDGFSQMARKLLQRPLCARTLDATQPGWFSKYVLKGARECGARGVVAHVMKFCDPYLVRLPAIREALRKEGLPLLILEGDCTMRALGQHRTRIQAFTEMLGG